MSDIKMGDRVRVTVEGVAQGNGTYVVVRGDGDAWLAEYKNLHVGNGITVEKIEPPVEVFGPGDVVRDRDHPGWVYVLTDDGYTELPKGVHYNDGKAPDYFTSREYERVGLS